MVVVSLGVAFQGLLRLFFFHVFSVFFGSVASKRAEQTTVTKETKIRGVVAVFRAWLRTQTTAGCVVAPISC